MNPAESGLSAWKDAVQKALGERPLASLTKKDGALSIAPLYTSADVGSLPDRGSVGVTPFVRGGLARGRLGVVVGAPPSHAGQAIDEAIATGAEAILVRAIDADTIAALGRVGAGEGTALFVTAPAHEGAALEAAMARGLSFSFATDPIAVDAARFAAGTPARALRARARGEAGGLAQIAIDTRAPHDAGAAAPTEIGVALASFATCLREGLDDLGIAVIVASSDDVFETLAKLRALRVGLAKVRAALGHAPALQSVLGVVSARRFVRYDVATNLIRGTTAAFGLVVGGADFVFGRPFDESLGGTTPFSRRLAMSALHVLAEEAGLLDVHDAAGGAYYVEVLAEQIGVQAWEVMRAIERAGGMRTAAGLVNERVAADAASRVAEVKKRKRLVVGLSDFALHDEVLPGGERRDDAERSRRGGVAAPVDGPARDGADFERLRDGASRIGAARGAPLRVVCVTLGPARDHGAREAFSRRLFEAGGFAVSTIPAGGEGDLVKPATADAARAPTVSADALRSADIVVVAGSDRAYAERGAEVVAAVRAATPRPIWLAGNPGALRATLDAAGLDDAFAVGHDVVELLERAQGAAAAEGGAR